MAKKNTVKYRTELLTGEVVNEFTESVPLTQVVTHCPRKWALIDLESGEVRGWREDGTGWIGLPRKAERALENAVRSMRKR